MTYIFVGVVLIGVSFSLIKMFQKKKSPSNEFTPYDDIENGRLE